MKATFLLVLAFLLTGCMSPQAVRSIVDEKIAANNREYVQPKLAKQQADLDALAAEAEQTRIALGKSKDMISKHQEVLLDAFRKQQKSAEEALNLLAPLPEPAPLAVPQAAPVE